MPMKLDQNGYNSVFRDFTKFAQDRMNAIDRDGSLGGLFHEWHGIVFDSKQGRQAILAKQVVDCTGGADVCFAAGANYRQITPVRLC